MESKSAITPKPATELLGRISRVLMIGLPSLFFLITVVVFVDGWLGRRAWNGYVKEATARGQKLSLTPYLPPKIPADENFAAAPPFHRVFEDAPDHPEWKRPFLLPNDAPTLTDIRKGKRTDLATWKRFCVTKGWLEKDDSAAPPEAVLRALNNRYGEQWAQFRKAAERPKCRFPAPWEKGFDVPFPHLAAMKDTARIASLCMEAHLDLHEPAAAMQDFRLGMRLVSALDNEPGIISGLARAATLRFLLTSVWSGLEDHLWDAQSCIEIESDLARFNLPADCRFAMNSERAAMNLQYTRAHEKKRRALKTLFSRRQEDNNDNSEVRLLALFPDGFLYANQERANRYYDEVNADLDIQKPIWRPNAPPGVPAAKPSPGPANQPVEYTPVVYRYEPETTRGLARYRYYFHDLITLKLGVSQSRFLFVHTRVQQARLACALEEFRLANHQYPETLEELVPHFLSALPRDVMNGEPFHYRRVGADHFLLYSVGMNQRDDGGTVGAIEDTNKELDWVWPSAAK